MMEYLFIRILNMSLTGGIVAAVRLFLRQAPRIFSYLLWLVVLFRLLCPFSFSSAFSLLEVLQAPAAMQGQVRYIPDDIGLMEQPSVALPFPGAGAAADGSLPPADRENSVNSIQIVLAAGSCIWLAGVLAMGAFSAVSYLKLRRTLKSAVREKGNIYRLHSVDTPFVCGIFSPKIYLPSALGAREEEYILLHEQIHVKRRDSFWRLLAYLALCVHWFNPFVWLAFLLSGRDMEMSCDEAVLRMLGDDLKKEYSSSLLSLASGRRIVSGMPLSFGKGETGSRIKNVLRYQKPARAAVGAVAVICIGVALILSANPPGGAEDAAEAETYFGIVSEKEPVPADGQALETESMPADGQALETESVPADGQALETESVPADGQMAEKEPVPADGQTPALSVRRLANGSLSDGDYRVYVASPPSGAGGIDSYFAMDMEDSTQAPLLAFAEDCQFFANQEMDRLNYGEVSRETFAALMEEELSFLNPPVRLTFEDGLVTRAVLEAYYGSGISYALTPPDTWYGELQDITGLSAQEALDTYYTLEHTYRADIGTGTGEERIMVYTGDIGDGESGMVLFADAEGEIFYSLSAHVSRAGWNNIYLGERDGESFIMTLYIEDRDYFGEYGYQVFGLASDGSVLQRAGSCFTFCKDVIPYDDKLFYEWSALLEGYLEDSFLLLSTQDGQIRTEAASEAGKYHYETLRRY